jgi:geranylgeranyl transferase type-1 subunit beta
MSFIDRLNIGNTPIAQAITAPKDPHAVISWLAYRQTELTDPDARVDTEFVSSMTREVDQKSGATSSSPTQQQTEEPAHQSPSKTVGLTVFDLLVDGAGMSGRTNKVADTCYGFWAGASLHVMQRPELYDHRAMRRYLGLAALSLASCEDVKALDPSMCLSKEAKARLSALRETWADIS